MNTSFSNFRSFGWVASFALFLPLWASAQTCVTGIPANTPTADFTIPADGTATHTRTNLMWDQCPLGLSGAACNVGAAATFTWQQAFDAVVAANAANRNGYSDWRLPNLKELLSVAERCRKSPAINQTVFPTNSVASLRFWTSTPNPDNAAYAWYVDFDYGGNDLNTIAAQRTSLKPVRMVRSGQTASSFAIARSCDLDINGDGTFTADSDGVLLARYLLGFRGAALVDGVALGASRTGTYAVETFMGSGAQYDVFGRTSPAAKPMADALVLIRLKLGVSETNLLSGIEVPAGAQFITGATVRGNVNTRCGTTL